MSVSESNDAQHLNIINNPMIYEENRLKTFANWKVITVTSERLARAGFYWPNEAENKVKCFCCSGEISEWSFGMTAMGMHSKYFPQCEFVLGTDKTNIPLPPKSASSFKSTSSFSSQLSVISRLTSTGEDSAVFTDEYKKKCESPTNEDFDFSLDLEKIQFKPFASSLTRLKSFKNKNWLDKRVPQDPERLVNAGFFYMGRNDWVQCFCCGEMLHDWHEEDDPVRSHLQYFPNCPYIRQLNGMDPIPVPEENENCFQNITKHTDESNQTNSEPKVFSNKTEAVTLEKDETLRKQNNAVLNASSNTNELKIKDVASETPKSEENICDICFIRKKCIALKPCGHVPTCLECSTNLFEIGCPICRTKIKSTLRIYL